jgi:hypothetical protein
VSKGPLGIRFGAISTPAPEAGALARLAVEVENTGTVTWPEVVQLSYHWLDSHDNPIVWDGIRTPPPRLAPGERATVELAVRGPIPPGRYRLALDAVAEHRAWFSELGSEMLRVDVVVGPRTGEPSATLPTWVEATPAWTEHVHAAHAEGYAVVAGSVDWQAGPLRRRPRSLDPYTPGSGRVPGFGAPLLCPSVLPGTVELEPLGEVAGLPAFAAPRDEPWIYDGRAVLTARPRSGRRPT